MTGWIGGFAGQFIEAGLHRETIQTDFVPLDFESRTCLSILDPENNTLTEIYEKGEPVPAEKVEAFMTHFRSIIGSYEAVTLSGSLPPGVPSDFYAQLIEIAHAARIPIFLDSSGEALKQGLNRKPRLIKPNKKESHRSHQEGTKNASGLRGNSPFSFPRAIKHRLSFLWGRMGRLLWMVATLCMCGLLS